MRVVKETDERAVRDELDDATIERTVRDAFSMPRT
jgi:hypothetical protein